MKKLYKITNKLEQAIRYKNIVFRAKETKILSEKPKSDKFHIEKIEQKEKKRTKSNGGKNNGTRYME